MSDSKPPQISISSGSVMDFDDSEPAPTQTNPKPKAKAKGKGKRKLRLKDPLATGRPSGWESAALPGGAIPDINDELSVLTGKVDVIPFSEKEDAQIVPTVLPGFNRAIRIGGAPTNCICLVHGPSKGGKTALCLAFVLSFQLQGHFTVYVDAEHTLDKKFASNVGVNNDLMKYLAPLTYEETTSKVEELIANFRKGRESGKIHPNRALLFIVDSITKLVPESELEELSKVGKGYPLRALMNSVWLDRLTPIVGSLPVLFVILAHEKVKLDANQFEKKYRVKGGEALVYDSTYVVRVQAIGKKKVIRKKKSIAVGILHKAVIEKNKVGICNEQFNFVMGNGKFGYPIGIDHCSGIVEEVKLRGDTSPIIRLSGGKYQHPLLGEGIQVSSDAALIRLLRQDSELTDNLITVLNESAIDAVVEEDKGEGDEGDTD